MLFLWETLAGVPPWTGLLAANIPLIAEKMSEQESALAGLVSSAKNQLLETPWHYLLLP